MSALNYLIYLLGTIFIWRLIRYISTPLLKQLGFYKYYSPLFMIMPSFGRTLDFHLGTSYDFLKLKQINNKIILLYLAEGLMKISDEIEKGNIPKNTIFYGNTFYLKKKSIKRFGFSARRMNFFESFLFMLNYIELCILKSITMKRPVLIPLDNVWVIKITAGDLLDYSEHYRTFYYKLREKLLPEITETSVS
ncbi:MAG: hypothetical protein SCALA702_17330 [Melioribacteraceae bacterium]|nr:MAG: hypothetical protein SCALA702_17330 [Melioribacteraceae bacterium]